MPDDNKYQGMYCCTVPMDGVRMLVFPDGTKSGVVGLDQIFSDMYAEGRAVTVETADEIVERLSTKNYVVPSVKPKYASLLLEEYGKYVQLMGKTPPAAPPKVDASCEPSTVGQEKKGFLSRFLRRN